MLGGESCVFFMLLRITARNARCEKKFRGIAASFQILTFAQSMSNEESDDKETAITSGIVSFFFVGAD